MSHLVPVQSASTTFRPLEPVHEKEHTKDTSPKVGKDSDQTIQVTAESQASLEPDGKYGEHNAKKIQRPTVPGLAAEVNSDNSLTPEPQPNETADDIKRRQFQEQISQRIKEQGVKRVVGRKT